MKKRYQLLLISLAMLLSLVVIPQQLSGQVANFTADITTTCIGQQVTFTDQSTGVTPTTFYEWSFGAGASPATASGAGPHVVTYSSQGSKNVSLTLTDGSVINTKTLNGYITVNQANTITLTSGASTNIQTVCLNASLAPSITYATTGATGAIFTDLPPGVTGVWNANVITISGTPTAVGNYNYTITLTGGCGSQTANGSITVNPLPTPTLTSSDADNAFCAGTSVTFTAGGGTDYTFRVNGVTKQTGAGHTYTTDALLNGQAVEVIVTSATGCSASLTGAANTVHPLPNPAITGPLAICGLPSNAPYTVINNAGNTYVWTVTGGTLLNGQGTNAIDVTWSTTGTGTISVTETVTATGCTSDDAVSITKAPQSVGGTLSGTKTVCEGSTSGAMTLSGYVGNILKWQYSDDLTNWVDTAYTATSFLSGPLSETTYFRAIVQSGACAIVSSTTATITVNPTPNLVINQPASVCAPATINLTAPAVTAGSDAGLTFTYWTNAQATNAYPTPAAATNGTYYIKGESASGCTAIAAVNAVVSPKPNLLITADNPVCLDEPLSLYLTGQEGSVWNWIVPDTTNVNPVVLFPAIGAHTYSAVATNVSGCSDTVEVAITVLPKPVVSISTSGGNNACVGQIKTYTATSDPDFSYQWYVNDVPSAAATTASFNHTITGTSPVEIKVKATDAGTGCHQYDSLIVNPIQSPVLVMEATRLQLCEGDQTFITLSSPSAPPVYFAWGDGLQGNVLTRGFIPTQDTLVWAESINSTGCITRDTLYITVRDTLAFSITSSNGNNVVCTGQEVTFTGPSATNYVYEWMVDGVVVAGAHEQTFVRSFTQNAIVKLTVTDTIAGCSGSAVKNITTKSAALVDLGADQQVCQGYTLSLSGPAGTGYTYAWFLNNAATAHASTQLLDFVVPQGTSLIRLEVTTPEGCTSSDAVNITSRAIPGISLTASESAVCVGENIVLNLSTTGATGSIWWDNITGINPRTVVPSEGDSTYVFWAQAANSLGCTARDSVEVLVHALPEVNLSVNGGSNNICIHSTATVYGPQAAGYQYQWYQDGMPSGTNSHQYSFEMTEDTELTLKVTDMNGCSNTSAVLDLQVIDLPGIILSQDQTEICLGDEVTLTINQQNISSYVWQDGLGGNLPSRTFIPAGTGTFAFSASGLHHTTGCISYDTAFVEVHALPVAHIITPALTTICQGQSVSLSTTTLANHQYKWMIDGDSVGNGATYVFNRLQSETITLQVKNNNGCIETDEITIQVEEAPEVDLGEDLLVCKNYTVDLQGPVNENYTYKWFVNGTQIANTSDAYSFIVTQAMVVRLEVKVGNCTTVDEVSITPLEIPTINVSANNSAICYGDTLGLQLSTQNASSYVWWDGFTGLTNRSYVPVENDTTLAFWAEAINGLGCKSRDTVLVRVNPLPDVPLTVAGGSNTVCFNAIATVSGPQAVGHHYQWFIDNVPAGTDAYQLNFLVTKDVTVKLTVTDANGCVNSNQISILSRNLPGIILSPDSLDVCIGSDFTLSINPQNINAYSWFDGLAGNLLQRTFEATTTGTFTYWAEGINSFGCISRDTAYVSVHALPEVFILAANGTTACEGQEVSLVGSGSEEDVFEWYVGGLLVNNTSTYTFTADQTVDVSLFVTNTNGCQQSDEITITVLDAPTVDLGGDAQVCEGYLLTFTGPLDAAHSYAWFVNNNLVSNDSSYSFIMTQNMNLRLDVTSPDGCFVSDNINLTKLSSPTINLTPDQTEFCLGETATLTLTTNGTSFIWWDGLGTNVHTRSFTPLEGDSTYAYWAEAVNQLGCTSRDTAFVTVNNPPVIDINIQGLANTFCQYTQATVVGPSVEGYNYQWFVNGLPAGSNADRLTFTVLEESLVKLEVTDQNGCFGSDSLTVFMHNEPGILLSPDSLDVCFGDSFTLTINPQNVVSYAWWDGLAGNLTSRTIVPTAPDITYVYWAQGINSIGCVSYDTAYISVHSLPEAVVLTPVGTSICQGDTMILQTPLVEGYTYEWTINGEVVSTEAQLEFVAENSTTVSLHVINEFLCMSTESVDVEVFDTPDINLPATVEACEGSTVVLSGPIGAGYSYAWYVNDSPTGIITPDFELVVTENAEVRLEMNTVNGCTASDTAQIVPLVSPKVIVQVSAESICLGESVSLTAETIDAVAFAWWDGFTGLSRIVTPSSAGIKDYWAEVISADNCVFRDSAQVLVNPLPELQLAISEGASLVCEGTSITFAASDNAGLDIDYVIWDNEYLTPMGSEPVVYFEKVFTESGWLTAEMVSMSGCSVADSIYISVEALPQMTITADTTVCAGSMLVLEASGGSLCIWSDDSGLLGGGYTLEIEALETHTYYATVFADGNLGCSTTDSVLVTVNPIPQIQITASQQNVCGGTPVVLVASGANAYVWSTGQTGSTITVAPLQTTTYSVTGINQNGCSAEAIFVLNMIPAPSVSLSGLDETYCSNHDPVTLTGLPVGGIFSGDAGVIGGKFYPSLAGGGLHQVVYSYVNNFGCTGSDTLQTRVVLVPEAINLGEDAVICPHEEVVFDAGPGFDQYFWSTGDLTQTATIKGNAYFAGTTRTITVIAMVDECSVSGSVELTIRNDCYIGLDETDSQQLVLMPNPSTGIFSIRLDGQHGELHVTVFDGRASAVFAGSFEACDGDGQTCSINLSHLPKGVYMVSIVTGQRQYMRKVVMM